MSIISPSVRLEPSKRQLKKAFSLLAMISLLCLVIGESSPLQAQAETKDESAAASKPADISQTEGNSKPADKKTPNAQPVPLAPQQAGSGQKEAEGKAFDWDPLEELDGYEEARTPEELAQELSPAALELREKFQQGIHLGLGASKPWTTAHFEYHYKIRPNLWTSAHYGIGGSNLSGKWQQSDYDLSVDSSHFGISGRYYPTESLPVFTSALLALSKWSGRIKATGIDLQEEEPALDQISTSFHAQGLSAALAIGCSGLWENGFFLEYTFVGIGLSKITGETIARNRNQSTKILEDSLESPMGFGFLNIAAGYFF